MSGSRLPALRFGCLLGYGIAKTIAFTTAALEHWANVEADWLMLIPLLNFFLLCLIITITFLIGFTGLRLWAARRTRFTWVSFPIGLSSA